MIFWKNYKSNLSQFVSHMKSERGSALVLVMFVVLLLTILGLAVLGATVGGAQRSETRENDVQSLHLAQKGLNEAAAYIQSELQGLKLEDIDPQSLGDILGKLDDNKSSLKVATELESTSSGSVDGIKYDDTSGKKIGKQSIKYTINISSKAVVNGVERILRQQVIIDSYPDFLKYVFGSEKTLRLNGAPILKGKVYAGEKLLVTNTPWYTYLGRKYPDVTTEFPEITSNTDGTASGEIHVQSMSNIKYKERFQPKESILSEDQEGDMDSLPKGESERNDILNKILHLNSADIKIKEKNKFVRINVEESFFDKLAQGLTASKDNATQKALRNSMRDDYNKNIAQLNTWIVGRSEVTHIQGMPVEPTKVLPDADPAVIDQYDKDLIAYQTKLQQLENLDSTIIFNGNLTIDGLHYKKLFYPPNSSNDPKSGNLPRWFIVAGNLEINNYTAGFLPVRANILVTGSVKIKGNVEFDSTMLVLGDTTVEDANIKGIRSGNGAGNVETKELVLISKGKVLVNRLHAFAVNEPSVEETMEAFFYTDSSGELYGVGSMFHLIGGFFAKGDLTVNAVKGKVTEPPTVGSLIINQTPIPERFVIDYKPDIYENQQSSLPRVQSVNVNVGPMQLVNR